MVCTFFGHKDFHELEKETLLNAIEDLIQKNVHTFYVGHQGKFDSLVLSCLVKLKEKYTHIRYFVVLAYLPSRKSPYDLYSDCSLFVEELERVHPKFAIDKRNKWMVDHSDYCICYVNYTWGGAYKFAQKAKKRGLITLNLGSAELL